MKLLQLGIVAAFTVITAIVPAAAQQQVSITSDAPIYSGPGPAAAITGTLPANSVVTADHCEPNNFCLVYYGRNGYWVEAKYLGGPVTQYPAPPAPQPPVQPQPQPQPQPWPQPQPPRPTPPPIFEEAGACFYSGRNYSGSSFCVEEGDSYSRLRSWDNMIRSVEVYGGAQVDLCSDSNLRGSCVTIRRNTSRLPTELDRRASSLDVY